jgi:FKBP-type peptidyl-prolyl cis-trans isomerase 2
MAQAELGDTVEVQFTGKLDDGTVFESSSPDNPLKLKIGAQHIMPAFEQAIVGMYPGESKTVNITAENAFGHRSEDNMQQISRSTLPADLVPEIGMRLNAKCVDGRTSAVVVTDVTDSTITIDTNHALAGKDLTFDIKLVTIL